MLTEAIDQKYLTTLSYSHVRYKNRRRFLRFLLRTIGIPLLVKVDHIEGLENLPPTGPAILMINHIALVDPIVILHVFPRDIVPLAKIEVYDYPVIGILPRIWGVIPVRREEVDRRAIQQVIQVLRAGEIVLVAPEGTRHPEMGRGKEGIAYLASRMNVPVIPVAVQGTRGFPALRFSRRWSQAGAIVRFGKPFRFRTNKGTDNRHNFRQMTDEAMYILAKMLPPTLRGYYHDLSLATEETIEWVETK